MYDLAVMLSIPTLSYIPVKLLIKFLFFLGEFDDYEVQSKLEEESAEHGDILQETFQDSYNNLTIKSIFILKYYVGAADNLGNKFLLKTDDDSFVHLEALWDLAKSRMAKKSNNLIGYLQVCEIYISLDSKINFHCQILYWSCRQFRKQVFAQKRPKNPII